MRSFYHLSISVDPGGARKGVEFVYGTEEEIKIALADDLENDLHLLLFYEEFIRLDTYQAGLLTQTFDLLPYISVAIPGYPLLSFDDDGQVQGFDLEADTDARGDDSLNEKAGDMNRRAELGDFRIYVDWTRLGLEPLQPPVLLRGQFGIVSDPFYESKLLPTNAAEAEKIYREMDAAAMEREPEESDLDFAQEFDALPYGFSDTEFGWGEEALAADSPLLTGVLGETHVVFR